MNDTEPRPRPRGKPQDGFLSTERRAFCEGLLEGLSYRIAYESSGFKARGKDAATNARQLLKEPEIQAYLAARRMELRVRANLTDQRVLDEMIALAFLDPAEIVSESIEGPADILKLPSHVRRAIVGWKWDRKGRFILELADKQKALDQLARHLGLYQKERASLGDAAGKLLDSVFWRFVFALHLQEGIALAEAMRRAREDPTQVEDWGRSAGLLGPATAEMAVG